MKKGTVGNIYLLLLSGKTGKCIFSIRAIIRIIRAENAKKRMNKRHAREKEYRDRKREERLRSCTDTAFYWQLKSAVDEQFPGFHLTCSQSLPEMAKKAANEGVLNVTLVSEPGAKTTVIAFFTENHLTGLAKVEPEDQESETERENETEEDSSAETKTELEPEEKESQELILSPAAAEMIVVTQLSENWTWLEGRCQDTIAANCRDFLITPDKLPEEFSLWPLVCQKLKNPHMYGFIEANIVAEGVGIEVQIPYENSKQERTKEETGLEEPFQEDDDDGLCIEDVLAEVEPDMECVTLGEIAPMPDDSFVPDEEE